MSETGEMNGNGAVKRKAPRWMKIVLVISLMLNGLAIGAIGARAWKVHKHGHGYHAMHALGVHSFLRQLPRERRKELRKKLRQVRGELREHGYLSTKPLKGFATALSAEQYDRSKVEEAVRSFRRTHEKRAETRERYILELVDALTAQERVMLGRKMLKRAERRAHWHKKIQDWSGKD